MSKCKLQIELETEPSLYNQKNLQLQPSFIPKLTKYLTTIVPQILFFALFQFYYRKCDTDSRIPTKNEHISLKKTDILFVKRNAHTIYNYTEKSKLQQF